MLANGDKVEQSRAHFLGQRQISASDITEFDIHSIFLYLSIYLEWMTADHFIKVSFLSIYQCFFVVDCGDGKDATDGNAGALMGHPISNSG